MKKDHLSKSNIFKDHHIVVWAGPPAIGYERVPLFNALWTTVIVNISVNDFNALVTTMLSQTFGVKVTKHHAKA